MLVGDAGIEGDVGNSSGASPGGMPSELGDPCRWHLPSLELQQQVPSQAKSILTNAWGEFSSHELNRRIRQITKTKQCLVRRGQGHRRGVTNPLL